MHIYHINKNETIKLEGGDQVKDFISQLGITEPSEAVTVLVNDMGVDFNYQLAEGDKVEVIDFNNSIGKEVFWHTSAHVLAQAILRLYPEAKPTIGPPIQEGFYYDFANLEISEQDFPQIEKEMKSIIKERFRPSRRVLSKKEALEQFANNEFKCEIIESLGQDELTTYKQGEFIDLCRGPHLPNLGKIKAFKLTKTSGAYWRGDSENEMLTRIYGISFPSRELLEQHLIYLEEVKKRDHRRLGSDLDLFSFSDYAPGMPFIHAKGMVIWNRLIDFWKRVHSKQNYLEIKTPAMMSQQLWETSGHWDYYRENMYTSQVDDNLYAIKPMNCPGGMIYYKKRNHSYKEFPLRVAEIGYVHRHELSGSINGLLRVRCFHQDDAHVFMRPENISDEILQVLSLVDEMYSAFDLEYNIELSTRPEKSIGTDADWEMTTSALRKALIDSSKPFVVNEGDGAFYGPKIDFHVKDALGRTWQCGTIQLDMSLPEKFDLEYKDQDGSLKRPVMIHRAIFGSIERFFAILIEHYAGKFPLWLSPNQLCIIPVADRHHDYAGKIAKIFQERGFECHLDDSHESVGKKIRNAQIAKYNYMITIGDKELETNTLSIRTRNNTQVNQCELDTLLTELQKEIETKNQLSPFENVEETIKQS